MRVQPLLDFDAPVSGLTPAARYASASGAQAVSVVRGVHVATILQAMRRYGRLTIAETAVVTSLKEPTVCSTWNRLERAGWIEGLQTYRTYTTDYGRTVHQEYHALTARGRDAVAEMAAHQEHG